MSIDRHIAAKKKNCCLLVPTIDKTFPSTILRRSPHGSTAVNMLRRSTRSVHNRSREAWQGDSPDPPTTATRSSTTSLSSPSSLSSTGNLYCTHISSNNISHNTIVYVTTFSKFLIRSVDGCHGWGEAAKDAWCEEREGYGRW